MTKPDREMAEAAATPTVSDSECLQANGMLLEGGTEEHEPDLSHHTAQPRVTVEERRPRQKTDTHGLAERQKKRRKRRTRPPSVAKKKRRASQTQCAPCASWWAQGDSNLQPTDYESAALPLSYGPAGG